MYSLVVALQSSGIKRLKHIQRMVGNAYIKQLPALSEIADQSNHYHRYRQCLKNADGPVIPIIDVHLADLARNHQGRTSTIQGDGRMLINFRRYEQLPDGVKESLRYQETNSPNPTRAPLPSSASRPRAVATDSNRLPRLGRLSGAVGRARGRSVRGRVHCGARVGLDER